MATTVSVKSSPPSPTNKAAPESRCPPNNDFHQQRVRNWAPLLTPYFIIVSFLLCGVVCVIIGAVCLSASAAAEKKEFFSAYYGIDGDGTAVNQQVTIKVEERLEAPVFFYYHLEGMTLQHKRFMPSRSAGQLADFDNPNLSTCGDFERNATGHIYYPCGLSAQTMFTDTFALCRGENVTCPQASLVLWDEGKIVSQDQRKKYIQRPLREGETNIGPDGRPLPRIDDSHFIEWMRPPAAGSAFAKLYAVIDTDLEPGVYTVAINNTYPVRSYGANKRVALAKPNWMGRPNKALGGVYLAVGCFQILTAALFVIKQRWYKRQPGDIKYFAIQARLPRLLNINIF